ncbi:galactose-1-phosphate uridylyltransferase [Aureliella helgolandensis]|uniref:Galactose-1-phosphate uridylyltransferase n=1 Tax=Aureliella helgolandensis TaxID=2527968 RepID=A0A518G307_9BACT|nr:DUF4921 family protein [Aureliella helgolandensis]QDV22974.1 Galactose-1-phosphate uridylyltransferase [Aureliella helgolandensis]
MSRMREDVTSSEMRHDWLADRWVIIAPQRTARPCDFDLVFDEPSGVGDCPFCCGHEAETPLAVASYPAISANRKKESCAEWSVRVVPNKFPAVNIPGTRPPMRYATHPASPVPTNGINLFKRRGLSGGHEVIVESPEHLYSISQLDPESTQTVFRAYRDRLRYWLTEREICYAVVFKNVGQDAGASLVHTHSQLIATDILPPDVQRAAERMQLFYEQENECLMCRMISDEVELGVRIVEQTPDFVAFCPFASRLPALITILPRQHQSQFEKLNDQELEQVSWLTHRTIRRLEKLYPAVAYNFVIQTAPSCRKDSASFHWRLELFPRLTKVAGFEWGSDCFINPLAPEDAARALRQAGV